jgi:hypothetical protein
MNASYYCALAENIIPSILSKGNDKVIALVNPPRIGEFSIPINRIRNSKEFENFSQRMQEYCFDCLCFM